MFKFHNKQIYKNKKNISAGEINLNLHTTHRLTNGLPSGRGTSRKGFPKPLVFPCQEKCSGTHKKMKHFDFCSKLFWIFSSVTSTFPPVLLIYRSLFSPSSSPSRFALISAMLCFPQPWSSSLFYSFSPDFLLPWVGSPQLQFPWIIIEFWFGNIRILFPVCRRNS